MNLATLRSFIKMAAELQLRDERMPGDYLQVHAAVLEKFPELEKSAFDWKGFKEGLWDEGIPLTGATIGAALGAKGGNVLRGAALGYAGGGGASMARSYIKGEKPSLSRKLLAAGALGYGAGGLTHGVLEGVTHGPPVSSLRQRLFHPAGRIPTWQSAMTEEALPAIGATVGTGLAHGFHEKRKHEKP